MKYVICFLGLVPTESTEIIHAGDLTVELSVRSLKQDFRIFSKILE